MRKLLALALVCISTAAFGWGWKLNPNTVGFQQLQIVGTTGSMPEDTISVTTQTDFVLRLPFYAGCNTTTVRFAFDAFYIGAFGVAGVPTSPMILTKVAIEDDTAATTTPMPIGGVRSKTMAAGSVNTQTDPVAVSLVRDRKYWVRAQGRVGTQQLIGPYFTPNIITGAKFYYYDPAQNVGYDPVDSTGVLPAPAGSPGTQNQGYGPSAILGKCTNSGALSVTASGDSLTAANGDVSGYGASGPAFASRAALNASVQPVNTISINKVARGGSTAANMSRVPQFYTYLQYSNVFVLFLGENDLNVDATNADTLVILNDLRRIWSMARQAGVKKIVAVQMWPRTTSSDEWATNAGQTYFTGWGPGGKPDELNARLRQAYADGEVDYLFYQHSARDPTDPNKWFSNGTADFTTDNGTHPGSNAIGHPSISQELRALLNSIVFN